MEIFQQSITQIKPSNFNQEACQQIWQLRLSSDLSSILKTIKGKINKDIYVCFIYGEPGSGCTTLIQGVCQHLCESDTITKSDILYLSLNQGCNEEHFWDFVTKLAKEANDTAKVSLFTQSLVKGTEKENGLTEFLQQHFKVICIDNADLFSNSMYEFLVDVLKACKVASFLVFNQTGAKQERLHSIEFASSVIAVNGLADSAAKALVLEELQPLTMTLTEDELSSLCELLKCNPVAVKLVCGLLNSQEEDIGSVLRRDSEDTCNGTSQASCTLGMVLEWVRRALKVSSIGMLCILSSLRRPLPMLDVPPAMKELIQFKLLLVKQEGIVQCIDLHHTLKKYLSCKKNTYSDPEVTFDPLCHWLSLVSNQELQNLIKGAEENAWPFVPELWQFIKDVGKKESFDVKEHIVSKNVNIPSLTELQILQECLYHAYMQNNFEKLAAVTFVLDRFLFWQGDTKTSLAIVDYIQKHSPGTAIAPQLLVRRARFMKNEGNLRGAEEVLDEVSKERDGVGHWKYKAEYQSKLTKAACIQLKGEIQYSLGNWYKSASLLLESIQLFETLPRPDIKGLSLGYGLLCPCLRNMTIQNYSTLAQSFGLVQLHPLLAAYISAQEAARSSKFTPMFFVRHICHAGEVLLQFIQLSKLQEGKQKLLRVAIEDLKDSIQAHQSYTSLTSREQFYILVLASFKLSIALLELESKYDQERGHSLKAIAVKLYEHYCSYSGQVLVDDRVIELIDKCLDLLRLKKYHKENLKDASQVLSNYYKERSAQRLKENTRLGVEGLFANSKMPVSPESPGSREIFSYNYSGIPGSPSFEQQDLHGTNVYDKSPVIAAVPVRLEDGETVDRRSVTEGVKEGQEQRATPVKDVSNSGDGKSVDRCAMTAEGQVEEEGANLVSDTTELIDGKTVDRCAMTAEGQVEEEVANPADDIETLRSGKTVDRNDMTEEEENRSKTVDEYAFSMSRSVENDSGIIFQSLEDEAVSLPSQTQHQILIRSGEQDPEAIEDKAKRARDGILWKYDFQSRQWRCGPTMVYIGDPLQLKKGLEGAQRDVFAAEFINQDDPFSRYVAKRYRKKIQFQQYENDVLCQMTAIHYVEIFNEKLTKEAAGGTIGVIQFLPVVLLQLVNSSGHVTEVFNAEPYKSGEFTKLTNNVDWKNERRRTDLVLAYSHFTYQQSSGNLIIVDIQGWAPRAHDDQKCTYLTDPQIHSPVYKCFGTGNLGKRGFEKFWKMHSKCNKICEMLKLRRPSAT